MQKQAVNRLHPMAEYQHFFLRKPFTMHAIQVREQLAQATRKSAPLSVKLLDPRVSKELVVFLSPSRCGHALVFLSTFKRMGKMGHKA